MASCWIETRITPKGHKRWRVRYRAGGRDSAHRFGGSFASEDLAQKRRNAILADMAARRIDREPKRGVKPKPLDRVYGDARRLSQQISMARDAAVTRRQAAHLREAEELLQKASDVLYEAWQRSLL